MRKNRNKIVLILLCVGLSLYFLYPTYKDHDLQSQLSHFTGQDSLRFVEENENAIKENRLKRIKLGLDLQGGMRVVLEVDVVKLLEDLAKNKDETFTQVIKEVRSEVGRSEESAVVFLRRSLEQREIRLSRYYGNIRDSNDNLASFLEDESRKSIDRAMEIVRNRVDQYGVSEPSIQKLGTTRIIV